MFVYICARQFLEYDWMRFLVITLTFFCFVPLGAMTGNSPLDSDEASKRVQQSVTDDGQAADLEQMIGQMIVVGFVGDTPDHKWFRRVVDQVRDGKISGVLYLKRNIRNEATVSSMNARLHTESSGSPLPFIMVDQEGGRVERLTEEVSFPHTLSAARIASTKNPREAYEIYSNLAANLRRWGFNVNLGPVVDLNTNPHNPIIGALGRSFSADADVVAKYAAAFITAHRDQGVLTVLKHFPGHGSSSGDSHAGSVDVSASWSEKELDPYRELIDDGYADLIMSAHVMNANLQEDEERLPVSLSPSGLAGTLREDLEYGGIIISDDLQMGAIVQHFGLRETLVRAVKAGNDLLVFANDKNPDIEIPEKAIEILSEEAKKDEALHNRISESYNRIVSLKKKIRLSEEPVERTDTPATPGDATASTVGHLTGNPHLERIEPLPNP